MESFTISDGDVDMTPHGLMSFLICVFFIELLGPSKLCSSKFRLYTCLIVDISMGIGVQSKAFVKQDLGQLTKLVQDIIMRDEIVIFSKTYCPYCKMAKEVFDALNHKYTVIELDEREDGSAIQTVLGEMTGVKTVPRVFINGRCIGGGSEIKALFESGNLMTLLKVTFLHINEPKFKSGMANPSDHATTLKKHYNPAGQIKLYIPI